MGVLLELDSRKPYRYAAVVYHVLESISGLERSFRVIFVAEERASKPVVSSLQRRCRSQRTSLNLDLTRKPKLTALAML